MNLTFTFDEINKNFEYLIDFLNNSYQNKNKNTFLHQC